MSEFESRPNPEEAADYEQKLGQFIEQYFHEDKEFVMGLDFEEALGFIYGQLLEQGQDPDEILAQAGVIERGDDEV